MFHCERTYKQLSITKGICHLHDSIIWTPMMFNYTWASVLSLSPVYSSLTLAVDGQAALCNLECSSPSRDVTLADRSIWRVNASHNLTHIYRYTWLDLLIWIVLYSGGLQYRINIKPISINWIWLVNLSYKHNR